MNKILRKIARKAVLDDLNCKIFFVSQPWWLRIFRHIPTDHLELEVTAKKWNYLITMTTGIQNVISSTVFKEAT